jgi:sugar transferase (PEP-CTERM/EpsH1 system associated)
VRVLFLTHRLPYAPNRGDRLRAYHMLQHMRAGADVELLSLVHDDDEAAHVADMRAFVPDVTALRVPRWRTRLAAAAALPTRRPLTHALLDAPGLLPALHQIVSRRRPDVVFAYCSGMARLALQPPLADIPLVLDFVDVDSQKWRDLALESRWPHSWIYRREAATLGAFEARAAEHAAAALVVNPREAAIARSLTPHANVQVLSNGVEVDRLRPLAPPAASTRAVFCGVMDYAPNDDGMQWFVREVWPLVRARSADATLAIVGSGPTQALRELCAGDASITVTGRVPDVRDWLWTSAVGIAPLRVARGVQNKALEAIAAGLPIVITDAVAGGLPPEAMHACRVANTPQRFANHVINLLARTPQQRRAMAAAADFTGLTWSRTLQPLLPLLERAAESGSPAARVQEFCTRPSYQATNS